MGMPTMFADGLTDFSSILENSNPLNVSDVLHKAFIRVTEEGTEVVEGEAEGRLYTYIFKESIL